MINEGDNFSLKEMRIGEERWFWVQVKLILSMHVSTRPNTRKWPKESQAKVTKTKLEMSNLIMIEWPKSWNSAKSYLNLLPHKETKLMQSTCLSSKTMANKVNRIESSRLELSGRRVSQWPSWPSQQRDQVGHVSHTSLQLAS